MGLDKEQRKRADIAIAALRTLGVIKPEEVVNKKISASKLYQAYNISLDYVLHGTGGLFCSTLEKKYYELSKKRKSIIIVIILLASLNINAQSFKVFHDSAGFEIYDHKIQGDYTYVESVKLADSINRGKEDWRLPTIIEMQLLYTNLFGNGAQTDSKNFNYKRLSGFSAGTCADCPNIGCGYYWSSTISDDPNIMNVGSFCSNRKFLYGVPMPDHNVAAPIEYHKQIFLVRSLK